MSSEQEHFLCDKKQISFLTHNAMKSFSTDITLKKELVSDPLSMTIQPAILDVNLTYGLKNVKIELPKVNIPNEVLMKHEVDRFRKLFQCKHQTARKSLSLVKISGSNLSCSEGSHLQIKPEVQFEEGLRTAAKILNFTCTKCKDNIRYSPNDLQKHFQLLHYGELPLYPCEMCSFSANDFQSFKQHRRIHRSTLVKCELCNDEQVYTLLALTKHFISKHCVNGHFRCEKCGFSTRDVGTFVQHIHKHKEIPYKCGKCHQENLTEEELQNHLLVHTSMFSFGCPYCSYSTSRKDYLLKHIIALHRDHLIAKEKLEKDKYEKRIVKTPAGLKLVLRRYKMGASKKTLWRWKKISSGSDSAGEENTQVLRSVNKIQTNAEELNQCLRDVEMNEEKDQIKYTEKRHFMGGMLSATTAQYNKADDGASYGLGLLKNAVHGPTVLMVKNNKISVPANYSAKFMGFKMVDGKQHIVIKLLPTSKQSEYLLGQKIDPVKDGSAAPLLQTADPCGLSSGAILHVTDQSTLKNNCVHPLTSPPFSCPAPHSEKTKVEKQNHSILYGRSVSETVAPSNIGVGKGPNYLPMKVDATVPPHEDVTKVGTQTSISWGSFRPSSHPQVLPPAITNTLHYDPLKMPFFPDLKMQDGGLNNSNGTNNLCCSTSVDSSNEGLLSFHNYSKMDSLDNPCSIWTGTVGTIANAANDSSQVSGGIASREFGKITISASEVKGGNGGFRNVRRSCNGEVCGTVNDSLNSMPFKAPLVMTNSSESSVKATSSVKVLPKHQDAVFASLESVKQQEIKQEQHVYALSPDGQQEAFLKCMTPNQPVVHKPIFFQDNAHQNYQPKKTGAMQQQLLLKIKTPTSDTLSDNTQSVSNSVPSLQVDNLQFLTPALAQKQTNLTFNDALNLTGGLMPANASLASSNPARRVPPIESVYSAKSAGMQLQKYSVESTQVITANKRSNSGCRKSTWSTQNRTAKAKPSLKQARSKSSGTAGGQRKKNFKRKRKASCPEPPRKKAMLHRKCKEKNQAEIVSESGSPYKSRASKKTVRTLKLLPFNSNQLVKCPRRNQPVVVLNHPDADVPEVVNLMKTIAKFKGHVLKVLLSKRTVEALLQQDFGNPSDVTTDDFSQKRHKTIKPINPVKERFVLKLTLKKTSKNNYQIVKTTSNNTLKAKFSCWFCGRIFDNQDNWVGHGQRHLMEATRDWNSLM
ncbi:Z518A protein, partial [Horornis vulcanius]|nr:Z518A protein [Horornis vulcanius]